jgi:hypothetical protein
MEKWLVHKACLIAGLLYLFEEKSTAVELG